MIGSLTRLRTLGTADGDVGAAKIDPADSRSQSATTVPSGRSTAGDRSQ
jgi:hypothetical protein